MLEKFKGYRTLIVFAVMALASILRPKHPELPDESTLMQWVDTILNIVLSVPGAAVVAVGMRAASTTAIGKSA